MVRRLIVISLAVAVVAFALGASFGAIFLGSYAHPQSGILHELVFTQEGACSPAVYAAPWAVILNSKSTIIEPAGSSFPSGTGYEASPTFKNYSVIVFAVASGTYDYSFVPGGFGATSGTVIVNSSDATIVLPVPVVSCTTTTSIDTETSYSFQFPVSVNYSGNWSLAYEAFHNGEDSGVNSKDNYTGGVYMGDGSNSTTITLTGSNTEPLVICATASKLDSSNLTLTLDLNYNEVTTSQPFGSTSYCTGVAP
jgi:hypothetical protein